jgi:hypothetical protein
VELPLFFKNNNWTAYDKVGLLNPTGRIRNTSGSGHTPKHLPSGACMGSRRNGCPGGIILSGSQRRWWSKGEGGIEPNARWGPLRAKWHRARNRRHLPALGTVRENESFFARCDEARAPSRKGSSRICPSGMTTASLLTDADSQGSPPPPLGCTGSWKTCPETPGAQGISSRENSSSVPPVRVARTASLSGQPSVMGGSRLTWSVWTHPETMESLEGLPICSHFPSDSLSLRGDCSQNEIAS